MGADYRHRSGTRADLSSCDWAPPGKLGLRSGAPDLLRVLARLADELQAAGAPCGDWPAPICSLPLKRTRANVLESRPRRPRPPPPPPSSRRRSFLLVSEPLRLSPPPSYQDLFFSSSRSSRLSPSPLPAAASCHRSHFSSPEAHSWVRGNVWLYLHDADILLDSYCFGAELPHSKFIKGQFNSKFMKWASVKVLFVCSPGASCVLSGTLLPFPALIGIYWVVSFSSILGLI